VPEQPILVLKDVHAYQGPSHVLQGISLELGSGALALVGRNGAGKSTMAKAIMGLLHVASGEVLLNGESIANLPPYAIAARGVGYVPQGRELFPSLTVDEHLRMVRSAGRRGGWDVGRIYALFPGLAQRAQLYSGSLSGGEQQMLAIGRALATDPRLLLMDEPSEGLAPTIVELLLRTLRELVSAGLHVLLIEQNLHAVADTAKEVCVMVSGRIDRRLPTADFMADRALQEALLGVKTRG